MVTTSSSLLSAMRAKSERYSAGTKTKRETFLMND